MKEELVIAQRGAFLKRETDQLVGEGTKQNYASVYQGTKTEKARG